MTTAAAVCPTPVVKMSGHPIFPKQASVLGSLWILREIELAWAAVGDITIDETGKTASWFLPVSKTDARAKACTRSWGCTCNTMSVSICPYHVMLMYLTDLRKFFEGTDYIVKDETPLFPDYKGEVIKKTGAVAGLELVVGKAGERVTDSAGRRRFGGHSMRVTGSRFWAGMGLEVFKIQIFARWGSTVILRYVADVPIANLTGDVVGRPSIERADNRRLLELLQRHIKSAELQINSLRADVKRIKDSVNPSFVQNAQSKAWHRVLVGGPNHPPTLWRTWCGWRYSHLPHTLSSKHPGSLKSSCACFPPNREGRSSPSISESSSSDADESG